jgi:hypothetical protein
MTTKTNKDKIIFYELRNENKEIVATYPLLFQAIDQNLHTRGYVDEVTLQIFEDEYQEIKRERIAWNERSVIKE